VKAAQSGRKRLGESASGRFGSVGRWDSVSAWFVLREKRVVLISVLLCPTGRNSVVNNHLCPGHSWTCCLMSAQGLCVIWIPREVCTGEWTWTDGIHCLHKRNTAVVSSIGLL